MMNPIIMIFVVFGVAAGLLSTLYLTLSIPVVLVYKLVRKVKNHTSMFA